MFTPSAEKTDTIPQEFKRAHVIIVDDDPTNRTLLRGVCDKLGIGLIDEAEDGVEALDLITRFRPDLILLDIQMPRMNGMELMQKLRANEAYDYLSILVQTGLQGQDDRIACFNVGATDVVSRPFHLPELKARIRAHLRSAVSSRVLFDFRNRIQAHLEITHNFLSTILPPPEQIADLTKKYGLTCSNAYHPHDEIGGDLWSLRKINEDVLCIILIDASAHGLAGAINALRVDCLLQVFHEFLPDPAGFLNRMDAAMSKISFGQLFAGAVIMNYNRRTGEILYAGTGSPSPLLCHHDEITQMKTGGMFLGSGMIALENKKAKMEKGDTLLFFSDGWADDHSNNNAKITSLLQERSTNLAEALAQDAQAVDDLTLITLHRS